MDPDQTAESVAAQACVPPAAVSSEAAPAAAPAAAPGPVEDASQAANPILAAPSEAPAAEGGGGPTEEGMEAGKKLLEGGVAGGGLLHAGIDFAEGAAATTETVEAAEKVASAFSGPTMAAAGLAPTEAIAAAAEGAPSLAQTAAQAQFAASEGGLTAGNLLAPVALASGAMESAEAISSISEKGADLENVPNLVKGGLETTSGAIGTLGLAGTALTAAGAGGAGAAATAAAAAAAPVAMVAGAGAGGMAVGGMMASAADSQYAKGWGDDGKMSAMDKGASLGTWVDSHIGDKNPANPSVLGGIAAGVGGIGMGVVGAGQAAYNWLGSKL